MPRSKYVIASLSVTRNAQRRCRERLPCKAAGGDEAASVDVFDARSPAQSGASPVTSGVLSRLRCAAAASAPPMCLERAHLDVVAVRVAQHVQQGRTHRAEHRTPRRRRSRVQRRYGRARVGEPSARARRPHRHPQEPPQPASHRLAAAGCLLANPPSDRKRSRVARFNPFVLLGEQQRDGQRRDGRRGRDEQHGEWPRRRCRHCRRPPTRLRREACGGR